LVWTDIVYHREEDNMTYRSRNENIDSRTAGEKFVDGIGGFFGSPKKLAIAGLAVLALVGGAMSYKVVGPTEKGVVLRLGMVDRVVDSGPYLIIPVVEKMVKQDTQTIYRKEFGFRTTKAAGNAQQGTDRNALNDPEMENEAKLLTADQNICDVSLVMQYNVDPLHVTDYLLNLSNKEKTIDDVAEASVNRAINDYGIDEILVLEKDGIQNYVRTKAQGMFDEMHAGIKVTQVNLQQTRPPAKEGTAPGRTVSQAFTDVENNKQQREGAINGAIGYQNEVTTTALGDANKTLADALAYKATRLGQAQRDVQEFLLLEQQYKLDPEGTKMRLYFETMEKIPVHRIILDEEIAANGGTLGLINLGGN
jgi:modulator of FtsH protease HflK